MINRYPHKLSIFLTLVFISLLSLTPALAVYTNFENISNLDGLTSDKINAICQDEEGFIWIATVNGLNYYTGTQVNTLVSEKHNTLLSSNIRCLCPADNNRLWVGTNDKGLFLYERQSNTIINYNTNTEDLRLISNSISDIMVDSEKNVWIATQAGITRYTPTTNQYTHFLNGNRQRFVTTIYEDSRHNILVGTWNNGIYRLNKSSHSFEAIKHNTDQMRKPITALYEDHTGQLWVGTWGKGLYRGVIDNAQLTFTDRYDIENEFYPSDYRYNIVYDITQDSENQLWLGTDAGLGLIKAPKKKELSITWIKPGKSSKDFKAKDATQLFIDNAKNLWIGTQGDGISKLDFSTTTFKTYESPLNPSVYSSNIFSSFWEYDGKLYTGMYALGFGQYDRHTNEIVPYKRIDGFGAFKDLPFDINAILKCEIVDNRYWWLQTRYQGILVYDTKEDLLHKIQVPGMPERISCMLHEGHQIWLGGLNTLTLLRYDETLAESQSWPYQHTVFKYNTNDPEGLCGNNITAITRDKKQRLWVSFLNYGIAEIIENPQPSKTTFIPVEASKSLELPIQTIYTDSKNRLWLGTVGKGLFLFQPESNTLLNYSKQHAIKGDIIYAIIEDDNYKLWLSTNDGISSINLLDLEKPYITNFNALDGLQGNIFLTNAVYKNPKGELFFGGYHGFNIFHPKHIKFNTFIPPIAYTNIEVDQTPQHIDYSMNERLHLNHNNKSFLIEFAALSYTKSNNNQYLYKLEGYDDSWVKTKNGINSAIYGQIPAGEYTFLVKGANNNGIWNETPLKLGITIKKSPYKTILAYIIYVLIIIASIGIYIYYAKRRLALEQAYQNEQNVRLRIEKINQFKLKFFTNISHELLTPLSIISSAIEQFIDRNPKIGVDLAIAQRNTNRLSRLIKQLLDFRKVESNNRHLQVEKTDINALLSSLKDNFLPLCAKKNIKFELLGEINTELYLDVDKVDKILHNILSNAFKHTPEQGTIRIEYELRQNNNEQQLCIIVSDSGDGIEEDLFDQIFERFYRIDDRKHKSGTGIGLAYTRSLVMLHKGTIAAQNNSSLGGASFVLELPISANVYSKEEILAEPLGEPQVNYAFADEMDEIKIPLRETREKNGTLPKILLVEDNHDMRTIMRNFLSKYFEVYESENGIEGLITLNNTDIEIIISDIMMPEMDGLTFCRKVKTNLDTSHIPIILTTAKQGAENYIEGYEAQADSYITKPVNLQLLLVRIINLLNQRKKLQEVFSTQDKEKPSGLRISILDQELLSKINTYIDNNLNNNQMSVSTLSNHIGISNSVLYKKVKAYTGISPNEYIRSKRLNKGAELLKKGYSPGEAGYDCGFNDPSYFSACFKKQYGVTPKKYIDSL